MYVPLGKLVQIFPQCKRKAKIMLDRDSRIEYNPSRWYVKTNLTCLVRLVV